MLDLFIEDVNFSVCAKWLTKGSTFTMTVLNLLSLAAVQLDAMC